MFTQFAASTDTGKVRAQNEDCYSARPDLGLWIVADGMGGHEKGQLASKMACELICEQIESGGTALSAINLAHQKIKEQALHLGQTRPMGTTVVLLHHTEESTQVCWVGDSRAYIFKENTLQQITTDHSLVQKLLDRRLITEEEAASHPRRNMITQSLGMMSHNELDIGRYIINRNTEFTVLLCSDGLSNELSDQEISEIINAGADLESTTNQLITAANLKGGRDNITAMLMRSY